MADSWVDDEWGYEVDSDFGGDSTLDSILISSDTPKNGGGTLIPGLAIPELASTNFNGSIPRERVSITAGSVTVGKFLYLDENNGFYTSTQPTDADISYLIVDRRVDGSNVIFSVLKEGIVTDLSQISVSTSIWIVQESWSNRDNGTSGWVISSEGNSIFNNVSVRGEIQATAGYFGPSSGNQWIIGGAGDPSIYFLSSNTTNLAYQYDYTFDNDSPYWFVGNDSLSIYPSTSTVSTPTNTGAKSRSFGIFTTGGGTYSNVTARFFKSTSSAWSSTNAQRPNAFTRFSIGATGADLSPITAVTSRVLFSAFVYVNPSFAISGSTQIVPVIAAYTNASTEGTPLASSTTGTATWTTGAGWIKVTTYLDVPLNTTHLEFSIKTNQTDTPGSVTSRTLFYIDDIQIENDTTKARTTTSTDTSTSNINFYIRSSKTAQFLMEIDNATTLENLFTVSPTGALTSKSVTTETIRLTGTGDVSTTSSTHPFQIGSTSATNMRIDPNEIQAVDNSQAANLNLNVGGGDIRFGNSTSQMKFNGQTYVLQTNEVDAAAGGWSFAVGNPVDNLGHMRFDTNEIQAMSNNTTATTLNLNTNGGDVIIASSGSARFGGTANSTYSIEATSGQFTTDLYVLSQILLSSPVNTSLALEVGGSGRFDLNLTVDGALTVNGNSTSTFSSATTLQSNGSIVVNGTINGTSTWNGWGGANFRPTADNVRSLGSSSFRWVDVWAVDSTINTSDIRAKNSIEESDLGLSFINMLNPVKYKWNVSHREIPEGMKDSEENAIPVPGQRPRYGLIAQDVKDVIDSLGIDFGGWVKDDLEDPESRQSLRYTEFISPMIKAIQELSAKNTELENRIIALENNL